ncbi:MAG TPA: RlmE family RNA methyltransferase [Spirochaetia bacterium]|nr:RlmE family RNA methyltransferase [Spirochaetia bacterium]
MARDTPDHYTQRAHREGYPARSVYKLQEAQERHHLLKPGNNVLDVGASPGSWSAYAAKAVGNGHVYALDLNPLNLPGIPPNLEFIQGDVFSAEVQTWLAARGPFDVVLSDAAPSTTGNRTVDTARSSGLVDMVLEIAGTHLRVGGNLMVKIFQGGDEQEFLRRFRAMFLTAKPFKPKSSRKESFETFLIGLGFKA